LPPEFSADVLLRVNLMLKTADRAKDPKERAWVQDELSRSANPVIALYARIAILLGPDDHSRPA